MDESMLPIFLPLYGVFRILRLRFGVPEDAFAFGGVFLSRRVEIIVPSIDAFPEVSAELMRQDFTLRARAF
jgi:hypothetical protein